MRLKLTTGLLWIGIATVLLADSPAWATTSLGIGDPIPLANLLNDERDQLKPRLAYGNGTYLVVWQQGRNYYQGPKADIFAIRLNASGRLLDTQPIPVGTASGSQETPQIAYNEGLFLVVWQDFRTGRDWDVYGARLTPQGKVLDPDGFLIAGGERNQALPVVAADQEGFLVAWQTISDDGFYRIHTASVSATGETSRSQPVHYQGEPKPGLWGYTPGWGYSRQPLRIDGDQEPPILTGGNAALSRTTDGWLLSWNDDSNWTPGARGQATRRFAHLARVDDQVVAIDIHPAPVRVVGKTAGRFASDEKTTILYAGWSLAGRGNRVGTALRLSLDDAATLPNPNDEPRVRLSGWNTQYMIPLFFPPLVIDYPVAVAYGHDVFLTAASQTNRLYGSRLNADGIRLDGPEWLMLYEAETRLAAPTLAAGPQGFLLVFQQETEGGRQRLWAKLIKVE